MPLLCAAACCSSPGLTLLLLLAYYRVLLLVFCCSGIDCMVWTTSGIPAAATGTTAAVPWMLTLTEFLSNSIPSVPSGSFKLLTERNRFPQRPFQVATDANYYNECLRAFLSRTSAVTQRCYHPVEHRGTYLVGSTNSEQGVSSYFHNVLLAATDVLKQQYGADSYAYMPVPTAKAIRAAIIRLSPGLHDVGVLLEADALAAASAAATSVAAEINVNAAAAGHVGAAAPIAASWPSYSAAAAIGVGSIVSLSTTPAAGDALAPPTTQAKIAAAGSAGTDGLITAPAAAAAARALSADQQAQEQDAAATELRRSDSSSIFASTSRRKPDQVLVAGPRVAVERQLKHRFALVGEMKARGKMMSAPGQPKNLEQLFNDSDETATALLSQWLTYADEFQARRGFLSCYDMTVLVEQRPRSEGSPYWDWLVLSKPILAEATCPDLTVLQGLAWLHEAGIADLSLSPPPPLPHNPGSSGLGGNGVGGHHGGGGGGGKPPGGDPEDDEQGGSGSSRRLKRLCKPSHLVCPDGEYQPGVGLSQSDDVWKATDQLPNDIHFSKQQPQQEQQQHMPAGADGLKNKIALPLCNLLIPASAELGAGGSGVVFRVDFGGQAAAVKVLLVEALPVMLQEAAMYNRLKQLQGRTIPQLLGIGLAASGGCCFLATSLVPGKPLSACSITPDVADAAVLTLQQLHNTGHVHGDIRFANMLMVTDAAGAAAGVVLVDLAATRAGKAAERAAEMQYLFQLLGQRFPASRQV
eukprot:GHRR01010824.1.p1 GENE.GHRR01010824.1~~GHRR01010824.1.p1  ORF type:complete len:752 (+),score=312.86 GHRR01010824.1:868-3123(+)